MAAVFGVVVLGAFVLLGLGIAFAFAVQRGARALPSAAIAELSERVDDDREVKVVGRIALAERPLLAPLTGRPCVYYRFIADEVSLREHPVSFTHEHYQNFLLEDREGRQVFVKVVAPDRDTRGRPSFEHFSQVVVPSATPVMAHDPRLLPLLAGQRIDPRAIANHGGRFNCHEAILQPGRLVAVCGCVREEVPLDPEGGGYRGTRTRLVLERPRGGRIVVTDDPAQLA